jgi:type II secretory pathway pseudopilin PulG
MHIRISSKAFTLIETLIAVFILMTAVVGPMSIAAKGLQSALIAKDQTTAVYLAQDGIEFARYLRDTACLTNAPSGNCNGPTAFNPFTLGGVCTKAAGCRVDTITKTVTDCSSDTGGVCAALNYDTSNKWFTYNPTSATIVPTVFTRTLTASLAPGKSDELIVRVVVTWDDLGSVVHTVSEQENIYAWQ